MDKLYQLLSSGRDREYPKGQIVLYQGEQTANVFRIVQGYIKVYDIDIKGNEKIVLILGPDNIFPIIPSTSGKKGFHYFYQSLSNVRLNVLPRKNFQSQLKRDHQIALSMLEYFSQLTRDLFARIECIEATNSKYKIAQVFAYLASQHTVKRQRGVATITVPLTHQTIADMAGVVRETASMQIKDFEKAGIIDWSSSQNLKIHLAKLDKVNTDA